MAMIDPNRMNVANTSYTQNIKPTQSPPTESFESQSIEAALPAEGLDITASSASAEAIMPFLEEIKADKKDLGKLTNRTIQNVRDADSDFEKHRILDGYVNTINHFEMPQMMEVWGKFQPIEIFDPTSGGFKYSITDLVEQAELLEAELVHHKMNHFATMGPEEYSAKQEVLGAIDVALKERGFERKDLMDAPLFPDFWKMPNPDLVDPWGPKWTPAPMPIIPGGNGKWKPAPMPNVIPDNKFKPVPMPNLDDQYFPDFWKMPNPDLVDPWNQSPQFHDLLYRPSEDNSIIRDGLYRPSEDKVQIFQAPYFPDMHKLNMHPIDRKF